MRLGVALFAFSMLFAHRAASAQTSPGQASLAGDTISGNVYMGEYLNAKFAAKRLPFATNTSTIRVPTGPPLAN